MLEIYQEIAKVIAEGGEIAVATVVSTTGSTPREVGAKMLVRADRSIVGSIGGGSIEAAVINKAIEVIKRGQPQLAHFSLTAEEGEIGMICGGDTDVFIEPILPPHTLYIFGGGHISLSLAKIGKLVGLRVAVIDDRPEYANAERFPDADSILVEDFSHVFPKLKIDKSSYLIIVTRGHKYDELVLEQALKTNAKYIGMIGSKTKNKTVFSHLLAKGIPQQLLDTVHAPIGLDIFAHTPEEIALSILAEIVRVRRAPA
jgi:xanthine dehydrogenase accessory factor